MQTMEDSSTDERFRQIDQRFDRLETSIATLGTELRAEIRESNAQLRKEIQDSSTQLREEIQSSNAQLREEIQSSNAELRAEIRHANAELRTEIQATHTRIDMIQRTLIQVGGGLIGTTILAFSGLIATQI
jgi:FtsZ-binding cell division protein ZapB